MRHILAALAACLLSSHAHADAVLDRLDKAQIEVTATKNAAARAQYAIDKAIEARKAEVASPPVVVPPVMTPPVDPADPEAEPATVPGALGRWSEDMTADYYDAGLHLAWGRRGGDWIDAAGTLYGTKPFASLAWPAAKGIDATVDLDVTALVRKHGGEIWLAGSPIAVYTREAGKGAVLLVTRHGVTAELPVVEDGGLSLSTVKDRKVVPEIQVSGGAAALRFDQAPDQAIERAVLRLQGRKLVSGGATLNVLVPSPVVTMPDPGVPADGSEADIVFQRSGAAWHQDSRYTPSGTINADGTLTVAVPQGGATGSTTTYILPPVARRETLFARIVMKLHDDWSPITTGGKLPGITNTGQGDRRKVQCGWGSRTANGTCWSARTNRFPVATGARLMGFGAYAYRYNRTSFWGQGVPSTGALPIGEVFVLDQMVKLNTIAADGTPNADGELAYWLNGTAVNHMTGIVWRTNAAPETLPSEYWLDVYVGGQGYVAPRPHTTTFYEVTLSTKRLPL